MGQTFAGIGQSNPANMSTGTKMLESGTKGLTQGFANMQNQSAQMQGRSGNGMAPIAQTPQPQVSPSAFTPQNFTPPQNPQQPRKPGAGNSSFYGDRFQSTSGQ